MLKMAKRDKTKIPGQPIGYLPVLLPNSAGNSLAWNRTPKSPIIESSLSSLLSLVTWINIWPWKRSHPLRETWVGAWCCIKWNNMQKNDVTDGSLYDSKEV